jgi:hypothetical protein
VLLACAPKCGKNRVGKFSSSKHFFSHWSLFRSRFCVVWLVSAWVENPLSEDDKKARLALSPFNQDTIARQAKLEANWTNSELESWNCNTTEQKYFDICWLGNSIYISMHTYVVHWFTLIGAFKLHLYLYV